MGRDADARQAWLHVQSLMLSDEVHDRFHQATREAGLPHPGALRLLLHLRPGDAHPMRALADFMRCDASYVTALVDALEQAGCAERQVSPADRRVKLVALTGRGEQARLRALAVLGTPPSGLARLTAAEIRTLARLLRKVAEPADFAQNPSRN